MTLLPPPVWPTTIVVWRVSITSYSCTTLSTCSPGPVRTCEVEKAGRVEGQCENHLDDFHSELNKALIQAPASCSRATAAADNFNSVVSEALTW